VAASQSIHRFQSKRLSRFGWLRQTEGMLRSIAEALKVDIAIPDHTTLSRRGSGLTILPGLAKPDEPLHLLVDSTGLKMYGEGEWLAQHHGLRSRPAVAELASRPRYRHAGDRRRRIDA
jgi:hypothetical protein